MNNVLIVDDDRCGRTAAARVLTHHGFKVHEAGNGLEALEVLERNPGIDRVITDGTMPKLDGPGLVRALDERGVPVRIAVVTATPECLDFAKERGLPHRAKPIRALDLAALAMRL